MSKACATPQRCCPRPASPAPCGRRFTIACFEDESECQLTTHIQNVVTLAYRVGKAFGDECQISDARYVGYVAARGYQLYEVSCQAGRGGEVIEVDDFGALKGSQDCMKVKLVGAACQLKPGDAIDPRIARAERTGSAPPPPPGARRTVITNPDWIRKPSGGDVDALYPMSAQRGRVNGRAVIGCSVAATGLLEDCAVIDESPAGFGFGAAALKMSRSFQMRPQTRDGVPVSGAQVSIPINFNIRRN
jgi:TonB family protein